jgi:hypothetical protein
MPGHEDDLVASKTEGFKVGEKKTIDEYSKLGMWTFPFLLEICIPLCTDFPRGMPPLAVMQERELWNRKHHSSCHSRKDET